uniref:Uncharacterized protein n=1 Tax=Nelumbo nucifera TaxID=4432 RepID=A0A822XYH9_NELNU|nr:TPA_asm: hypothetical protein HUJ06_026536 [Nelumbo nucifera]
MSFGCFDVRVKLYSETPKLSASMAAQKSLERMFSGLGKEKEIEAGELTRKVHELKDTKEFLNDDKAHNNMLLAKVQACAARNKIATVEEETTKGTLWVSILDEEVERIIGYSNARKDGRDGQAVSRGLKRIQYFRQRVVECNERQRGIEEELVELENIF